MLKLLDKGGFVGTLDEIKGKYLRVYIFNDGNGSFYKVIVKNEDCSMEGENDQNAYED